MLWTKASRQSLAAAGISGPVTLVIESLPARFGPMPLPPRRPVLICFACFARFDSISPLIPSRRRTVCGDGQTLHHATLTAQPLV